MASATTHFFNPLSITRGGNSLIVSMQSTHYRALPIQAKPIKLHFSHPLLSSPLHLNRKTGQSNLVSFVAQASDWAQQEEDDTLTVAELEEPEWGSDEFEGAEGELSDWDAEGKEEVTEEAASQDEEEGGVVDFAVPSEEAKIYVGNLPYDVESQDLATLFEKAGTVEVAEIIYDRQADRSRGFGFVTMSTVEEAEKAIDIFHKFDLNGRFLTVNKAAPRGTQPERPSRVVQPIYRIYVGNLPWDVDNTRLEQMFSEHGKVVDARVVYDRESGRSRGFAFVTMASEEELNDAIAALDGQSMDGRALRVNVAEERQRRGF